MYPQTGRLIVIKRSLISLQGKYHDIRQLSLIFSEESNKVPTTVNQRNLFECHQKSSKDNV